jgi:two-component sensor histidine kinase
MLNQIEKRLLNFLQSDYKHTLIVGFLLSYIAVTGSLAIINTLLGRYYRSIPELIFVSVITMTYLYYKNIGYSQRILHITFWTPAIHVLLLLYISHFYDFTVIYAIVLPLASFFLYELKDALKNTSFFYMLLAALILYMRSQFPEHPYLHSPTALLNTVFGSIFVIAFGLFYQLSFYRAYRQMKYANAEKEILLKEIHHRVKNNLNVIASIVDLQARGNNVHLAKQLQLTQSRIESIAIVHEMLYQENNDFASIDFQTYMYKLAKMIERLHVDKNIVYRIEGNTIALPINTMLDLGLITNELLTNSHKHAFANTLEPKIEILLIETDLGKYRYSYHDNGSGIAASILDSVDIKSLGLRLIRLSTKKMDAHLEFDTTNGLLVVIDFFISN